MRTNHRAAGAPLPEAPRVLLVRPTASGGLKRHVEMCAHVLGERGWRVVVAAPGMRGAADVPILARPGPADATALRRLAHLSRGADVVHAHGLRAGAMAALTVPAGTPLVVTLHNEVPRRGAGALLGSVLARIIASRADVGLGVSPDLDALLRRLGAREVRAAVIPAPAADDAVAYDGVAHDGVAHGGVVRAPDARRGPDQPDRPLEVLTVARLAPQKDLGTLLDAAAAAEQRAPGAVRWTVVGEGPQRDGLAARIAAEHLPVDLRGAEPAAALFAEFDVFALTSRWEGQPLVLQEALRAGLPIVATNAGGTARVLENAGSLVPVGHGERVADEVLALREPARRAAAAQRARERGRRLPGEPELLRQLECVYRDALGAAVERATGG